MLFGKKPVTVQIQAQVSWQVHHDLAKGQFVGVCPVLNLNAIGNTWAEFQQCANEAIELLFQDIFEEGDLERFLQERGWQLVTPLPALGESTPSFDIPWEVGLSAHSYEELLPA